jgi:hypothetical protein
MLLQRNGTKIEATLTEFYGTPALFVFGAVMLMPTEPFLRHCSLVQASPREIKALRQAGFKITGLEQ